MNLTQEELATIRNALFLHKAACWEDPKAINPTPQIDALLKKMDAPPTLSQRYFALAPVQMRDFVDNLKPTQLADLSTVMRIHFTDVAWRLGYLSARYDAGGGDQGHEKGVKSANKQLRAARKALGFAYPNAGEINV